MVMVGGSFVVAVLVESTVRLVITPGIAGAGGIGDTLYESIRAFQYGDD